MASQLAIMAAMYFASVELSAMEVCFLLNQDIIVDPEIMQHPKVLFLSIALPPQFEFEYPCNFTSPSPRYLRPYSIVPLKYLSTCFATTQCSCLGSTMNRLKVFTAKQTWDSFPLTSKRRRYFVYLATGASQRSSLPLSESTLSPQTSL